MKINKKLLTTTMVASLSLALAACGNAGDDSKSNSNMDKNMDGMDHSTMDMSGSKEVPKGLNDAKDPKFKVGDMAMIKEAHMEGMKGAEATIVGAYDTTVYSISYDPTNGGKRVTDHKWIIQEEIVDAKSTPYSVGDEVKVSADHMKGMQEATATIDSAKETTVYMIDFESTSGKQVTNHKWVTEDELTAE
ncbi:YdhK family protein [Exiguobacterium antarcticum]|uniref:YdhK family protein n=1 Tax=Exiguobacterium antarcticum TaxID=132920 RepID=A0ABT6R5P2_9BACL|nr:YdhK family protein [Exiguobacterium antarcticum]MDI3236125.1 YdhK family protein [Exiguobacterium antarcticum]